MTSCGRATAEDYGKAHIVRQDVFATLAAVLPRLLTLAISFSLIAGARTAHADLVDDRIAILDADPDRKARMLAGASLAKLRDPRAIPALVRALAEDEDAYVRGTAVIGLRSAVDSGVSTAERALAIACLRQAARSDHDADVRYRARRAIRELSRR